jgi:DNA-directed RNA polymerase beta' subunit
MNEFFNEYRFLTSNEIKYSSVVSIYNSVGVRFIGASQANNTLCDRLMGPATPDETCLTCNGNYEECSGHYGHIELTLPIIFPFHLNYVLKQLKKSTKLKIKLEKNDLVIQHKDKENEIITAASLLAEDKNKWDKYILQNMIVLAINKRPYSLYKKNDYRADPLTQLYANILKCNLELKKKINDPVAYNKLRDMVYTFYDGPNKNKNVKNLHDRIDGKNGRVKGNIIGSRINYTARAVATANPRLKIDQVSVPKHFCDKMTIPEAVTSTNIKYININDYKFYKEENGDIKYDLKYLKNVKLKPGDVLYRPLKNDDYVVINRQPSLHPNSMLAFRVVESNTHTFGMNLSVCKGFNLDFDGDEINMHVPQTLEARVDCETILNIKNNILSYQNGSVMVGLIYDAVLGIYELTKEPNGVLISKEFIGNICCFIDLWIPTRPMYFRELLSHILPDNFDLSMKFPLKNKDINVIIKRLHMHYSTEHAYSFINKIQSITNYWMNRQGYSTGMMDGYEKKHKFNLDISKYKTESEKLIYLNSIRDKFSMPQYDEYNGLIKMILAGSKGSIINYIQTAYLVGQQTLYGKRLTNGNALDGGFISSNFFYGLTPKEMFNLAICARANISDTAIQTPEAGYLAKQLCNVLENIKIHYDGTVRRNNKDIIQFNYGVRPQYTSKDGGEYPITLECLNYLYSESRYTGDANDIVEWNEYLNNYLSPNQLIKKIEEYRHHKDIYSNLIFFIDTQCNMSFFDLIDKRLNEQMMEPLSNVGVIAAQCISEPTTQMSLDSFHFTGIDSMAILGFPRIKELAHCTEKEIFVTINDKNDITPQLLINDCFDVFIFEDAPIEKWETNFQHVANTTLWDNLTLSNPFRVPKMDIPHQEKIIATNPFQNTWYTCNKCGKKESYLIQAQTRKSDEGITTKVFCSCGNQFTIS